MTEAEWFNALYELINEPPRGIGVETTVMIPSEGMRKSGWRDYFEISIWNDEDVPEYEQLTLF